MALLENKVVVVTGAGRGLGAVYARRLAAEGAAIVVNDVGRDAQGVASAEQVAASIRDNGGRAVAHTEDISTVVGGQSLLQCALDHFGRVDILVNNAGILRDKSFAKMDEADWDAVQQVNFKSLYTVTRPIFSWMKDNGGGGVIVNTSSVSGIVGNFGQTNYGASKAGVWGFSHVLALEGAKFGVRVWTLAPAATSALTAGLMSEAMQKELAPEHVAEVLLYMVSDLSGTRTGHTIFASGQSIRELKLLSSEGIPGARGGAPISAQAIAANEGRLYREEPALTIMDFSQ
ncbi:MULTISPECIES: SDR family NAD(P)-dependent oxidoreductase [Pandoraea]|uniref:KR domain-containing protein n=2 Tax=Pandoraea TaxID=93217 RepID=A0AAW7MH55_9BURK|nr:MULTISPECIES: SDR family NAD(P)-dependent oxidoreductase [Pandoraea]ALS65154.1 short-chain dehydrogenase [Pandoraea apista]MDN4572092.1 KR domain-containing protein [Pandoraea cepalis]MDN4576748.1 KR domain-containing protein [Pandoraea cepalis]QHE91555.1 SDR family NAD(P)-dependent oxidoreductase [Pandoraea fibrosis]QHF14887.1 SDR family NAD(P)-dependent oxidoreductase [Pandoraea fibrosis]